MNISSALAGYVHSAVVQPKPGQPRPVKDDSDSRFGSIQQQAALQAAAKGSVNLLV